MENARRAYREIRTYAPNARIFTRGNTDNMIANAAAVITQRSTCTFVAVALGKEVHTYLDQTQLKELMPIQNHGISAANIALICEQILQQPISIQQKSKNMLHPQFNWKVLQG